MILRAQRQLILALALLCFAGLAPAADWYVATNGTGNGTSWADATNSLQGAINASAAPDTVWVSNGVYEIDPVSGAGLTNFPTGTSLTNRVAIYKAITVRSKDNDPATTIIKGVRPDGLAAVRCVYMTNGASLIGFTLTNGGTGGSGADDNRRGGGVYSPTNNTIISNCVITGNSGNWGGAAYYGTLYNCAIVGNSAVSYVGGTWNSTLSNCTILGNSSSAGGSLGGVYIGTLYNCTIVSNSGNSGGGGAYGTTLYNCEIRGNSSTALGGGVANSTLYNCTVVGNSGSGTGSVGGVYGGRLINSIVYFNSGIAQSNWLYIEAFTNTCTAPAATNGVGNITSDPSFLTNGSGYGASHVAGDYRLSTNSPCINQGTNIGWMTGTFDLDGNPRIIITRVDMGAYEFTHPYPYLGVTPTNITNAIMRGRTARTMLTVTNAEGSNALTWMAWSEGTWTYWDAPTGGLLLPSGDTNLWVTNSALTNLPGAYSGNIIVVATNNNYPNFDTLTTIVTFVMQVMELQKTPDQLTNAVVMQTSWTTNSFQLINAGPGVLNYTIATNQPWLVLSQSSGALTGATDAATNTIIVTYTNTAVLTVGQHNGLLTISSTNGGGTTNTLSVTLTVQAVPMLGTTPAQLTNVVMAGQNAASQILQVWNASANYGIGYRVTTNGSWLSVAVTNNFLAPLTTNRFTVTYAVSSLTQPGDVTSNYNGTITVTATNEASGSPAAVPVSVRVNPRPRLTLSLTSLSPTALQGQNAASQQFDIWNANAFYTLTYTNMKNVSWLLPTPLNGTSTGENARITVQYSTLNLAPGISNAVITVVGRAWDGANWANAVNATQQIAVALTVSPLPTLATDAQSGYAYRTRKGLTPSNTVLHVWNGGQSPRSAMNYTSTPSVSWLSVTPTAGTSTGELDAVRVAVDPTGMNPWVLYSGTVRIDATDSGSGGNAYASPQTFTIEVELYEVKGHDFQGGGSGASDLVVYREATGQWAIRNLLSAYATNLTFGGAGFSAVPADYNGDGMTELGLFRPGSGSWYAWQVGAESVQALELNAWMGSGYVGVPGDYDGDGKVDPGVYLESSGLWMALLSGSGYSQASGTLGGPGYAPLPSGDYDGDGKVDPGVYHRTSGLWIVFFSSSSTVVSGTFGGSGFVLVPSDYDADSITDPAVYETATGRWYILLSTTLTSAGYGLFIYQIGGVVPTATLAPAPGDYDGDGSADLALYDTTIGYWYIMTLSGAPLAWDYSLGGVGYLPVVP